MVEKETEKGAAKEPEKEKAEESKKTAAGSTAQKKAGTRKRKVKKKKEDKTVEKETPKKGKEKRVNDIGIDVTPPSITCDDKDCPFHGTLSVRGQIIIGIVVSDKMTKSAVVRREHLRYIPKYERYEKRSNRYVVHNPPCISAKTGDAVTIMECRPLSKLKSYVIVESGRNA